MSVIIPVVGEDKDLESLLNKLLSSSGDLIIEIISFAGCGYISCSSPEQNRGVYLW